MSMVPVHINETATTLAFDRQAPVFDQLYRNDTIIQYKRKRVRDHMEKFLVPGSSILELNAGTGEDAVYFAGKGHHVHATDMAPGMLSVLTTKVEQHQPGGRVTTELRSFTALKHLQQRGPYDHIFSNFAGLNCTSELTAVLDSFDTLLRPGGYVTLVLLPRFCFWEMLLLFRGKFKTAFRRFSDKNGAAAKVEGIPFRCWYYNPSFIRKHLKKTFELVALEGLCTLVPPSYLQGFPEKHPKIYQSLVKKENKWKANWPWTTVGDYYIITLRKKQ